MKIGYARVSTARQADEGLSLAAQERALKDAGCEKVYTERGVSGAKTSRPALDRMLSELRAGDEVTVVKLDRLGRSLRHLIDLIEDFDARDVTFRSLQDGLTTSGPTGRLMLNIVGSFAEYERQLIRERTLEGLAEARRQGKVSGRRPVTAKDTNVRKAVELKARDWTVDEIAQQLGAGRASVYRWFRIAQEDETALQVFAMRHQGMTGDEALEAAHVPSGDREFYRTVTEVFPTPAAALEAVETMPA